MNPRSRLQVPGARFQDPGNLLSFVSCLWLPVSCLRSVVCCLLSVVRRLWSVVRGPRTALSPQSSALSPLSLRSASSGFTLLEVIIAFTILGLMSGIIFSSFRMSLNSYEKSQERLDVAARKRVLQDLIKRQIGSLFPVRPSASFLDLQAADAQQPRVFAQMPLFSGTSEAVTFATVAPLMLQENPGLTIVHYGLAQDEWGNTYLGADEAPYMGLQSFMSMLDPPTRTPLALIEDIVDLSFQYYGFDPQSQTYDWFDSWNGEELLAIPLAIRIDYDEKHILVPINASFTGGQFRQGMQRFIQGR